MSKRCAKCTKAVYPIEELKCLDKVWHKSCFRCNECNMALNMKNYKGYDKMPYCNAHYPTTRFTAVAETPEMSRIAQNTKMQSQVKYHEDFEKNIKGSKIQVADDPETLRIRASTNVISGVEYKGLRERTNDMETRRTSIPKDSDEPGPQRNSYDPTRVGGMRMAPAPAANPSPYSSKNVSHSTTYSSQGKVEQADKARVGSIADYDPMNENFGSLNQGYHPSSSVSQTQQWEEVIPEPTPQNHAPTSVPVHEPPRPAYSQPDPQPQRRPPSPEPPQQQHYQKPPEQRYDNQQNYGQEQHFPAPQHTHPQDNGPPQHGMGGPQHGMPQQPAQPVQQPPQAKQAPPGTVYQAMYDYEAQDEDEVGFIDGDLIVECQPIDEGWMFGTIRRTGQRGMLPANYVELLK